MAVGPNDVWTVDFVHDPRHSYRVMMSRRRSNGHAVRLAILGRSVSIGERVRVTRSGPLGLCQGRDPGLRAPASRPTMPLSRRSTAASTPRRNPQLFPQMQQPQTAGANSKLNKTWGKVTLRMRKLSGDTMMA